MNDTEWPERAGQGAPTERLVTGGIAAKIREGLAAVPKSPLPPPSPQSLREKVLDKVWDPEWHQMFRNICHDVLLVMLVVFAFVLFGRGMWWLITL